MFGRKAKRIRELEQELDGQHLISVIYGSRCESLRIALKAEREMYAQSIRKITIADLQTVFDALERYREILNVNSFPDPNQFELMLLYKRYGLDFGPVNTNNSIVNRVTPV